MYKHLLAIIVCLLITASGFAQKAKAYVDAKAYLNNDFTALEELTIKKQKARGPYEDYEYRLVGASYKINQEIKGKYWAIEVDSALYLNCTKIFKGRGYTSAFQQGLYVVAQYRSNKYLLFQAGRTFVFGVPSSPVVTELGPTQMAISAANTTNEDMYPLYNYLYTFSTDKLIYFNRGLMMNYVEASPKEEPKFIKHVNQLIKAEDENDGFRQ